jgi:hypothetical protein
MMMHGLANPERRVGEREREREREREVDSGLLEYGNVSLG